MELKFKVGDTVRVSEFPSVDGGLHFNPLMAEHIGNIGRITYIPTSEKGGYGVQFGQEWAYWYWPESALELVNTEDSGLRLKATYTPTCNPAYTAVNLYDCCPDVGSAATSKHYNAQPIQAIELMQAIMTPEEFVGFCKGNYIKYAMRAGVKQGESTDKDATKAKQYKLWWQLAQEGCTIDPRTDVV
jgi:hypothetical protein